MWAQGMGRDGPEVGGVFDGLPALVPRYSGAEATIATRPDQGALSKRRSCASTARRGRTRVRLPVAVSGSFGAEWLSSPFIRSAKAS